MTAPLSSDGLHVIGTICDTLLVRVNTLNEERQAVVDRICLLQAQQDALEAESKRLLTTAEVLASIVRGAHIECQQPMQPESVPEAPDG